MTVKNKKLIAMSTRAKAMETRILDCNGRRLASIDGPNNSALDFYQVGKSVVIVQDFAEDHGIEVFVGRPEMQITQLYSVIESLAKG